MEHKIGVKEIKREKLTRAKSQRAILRNLGLAFELWVPERVCLFGSSTCCLIGA